MQREVYRSVHWWRERVAREEDESTRWVAPLPFLGLHWSSFFFFGFDRFVLQKYVLFLFSEQSPADMAALLGIFRSSEPPLVKRRMKSTIKDAVKRGMSSWIIRVLKSERNQTRRRVMW